MCISKLIYNQKNILVSIILASIQHTTSLLQFNFFINNLEKQIKYTKFIFTVSINYKLNIFIRELYILFVFFIVEIMYKIIHIQFNIQFSIIVVQRFQQLIYLLYNILLFCKQRLLFYKYYYYFFVSVVVINILTVLKYKTTNNQYKIYYYSLNRNLYFIINILILLYYQLQFKLKQINLYFLEFSIQYNKYLIKSQQEKLKIDYILIILVFKNGNKQLTQQYNNQQQCHISGNKRIFYQILLIQLVIEICACNYDVTRCIAFQNQDIYMFALCVNQCTNFLGMRNRQLLFFLSFHVESVPGKKIQFKGIVV
eukprot:TRINITY_DN14815_c0_g1_i4.p2 TRINITY_DN14815_c0_g1~~TRINITY_DN14815_c0_g1_i4.p2  ORF type:complete len:312 (+),score=-21.33 TRINITY_DN14815_c0_g1_i4:629-1564(+)